MKYCIIVITQTWTSSLVIFKPSGATNMSSISIKIDRFRSNLKIFLRENNLKKSITNILVSQKCTGLPINIFTGPSLTVCSVKIHEDLAKDPCESTCITVQIFLIIWSKEDCVCLFLLESTFFNSDKKLQLWLFESGSEEQFVPFVWVDKCDWSSGDVSGRKTCHGPSLAISDLGSSKLFLE